MKLSEKIFTHRRQLGLSQEELAARLGVTRQAVSKWEQGTSLPELGTLLGLARTFGVTTDYLLSEEDPAQPQSPPSQDAPPPAGYTEWMDHLPRSLGRLFRRYGWLSGVYLMGMGALFILMGAVTRSQLNRMFGETILLDPNFQHPLEPMINLNTGIGVVLILAGLALAIWLKRKGKQD